MAAALLVPAANAEATHGLPFIISGTSTGATDTVVCTLTHPQMTHEVVATVTASGSAFTTAGVCDFKLYHDGIWTVHTNDGTAAFTRTFRVRQSGS